MMNKQFYVFEPTRFSGNVLYGDLGLKTPTFVEGLPEVAATWDPITLKKMAELDADHLFLVNADEVGVDECVKIEYKSCLTSNLNGVEM